MVTSEGYSTYPEIQHFGTLTSHCQDNILLDADFHVQIADFGLTRHLEATVTQSGARHQNFAAPELFGDWDSDDDTSDDGQSRARTQKSDIYAFGCLFYEVSDNDPTALTGHYMKCADPLRYHTIFPCK